MVHAAEELEAVAPLIDRQIEEYDGAFTIMERPQVGELALPVSVCTLIYRVLGYAFYSFMQRRSSKVWVKWEQKTPDTFFLEVLADQAVPPRDEARASSMLGELNQEVARLGGEVVCGGEMGEGKVSYDVFFRLTIPISS